MKDEAKTKKRLISELVELRQRVAELETSEIEHQRAEEVLQRREREIRMITENVPGLVSYVDADGRYHFVNKHYEEWFGIPRTEIIGKHYRQVLGEATYGLIKDHIEAALSGHRVCYEEALPYMHGGTRWVLADYVPDADDRGRVKGFFALVTDITELKRVEEALAKERNLLRTLIDNLPDYIYVKDAESRFVIGNIAVGHLMGTTTPDELVGKTDFDFYPQELAAQYRADEQEVIRSGQPLINREEPHIDLSTGDRRWLSTTKVPLRDSEGKIVGLVGIGRDITEQKRAEEEKEKLQAQLIQAQKMEAVGRLAGGVAHDFNNLLIPIIGYSKLLLCSLSDQDPLRQDVEKIMKVAERAASLTRQLLAFSRRQPLQPQGLDLNATVANIGKMLRRLIGEDIELVTTLEPELEWVKADPGQIEQVIMNLAVNARDAMPQGGKLTITTENVTLDQDRCQVIPEARPGTFVCLSVEDTGVGMDQETLQHIFEPFFTTKEVGQGTGLGLSVVYGIVEQHEGWINVYSEPGQGSTFKVYLPVFDVEPEEDSIEETISLQELQGRGERILVVEDEEGVRAFARRVLGENGYVAFEAVSAEEALDIFEREKGNFHLVFSDVVLSDRAGFQLADQLLAHKPGLQVLLSSGHTDRKLHWPLIRERGFRFLQKPYAPVDLLRAIREAIEPG